ncbi:MAG: hypothetical protein ACFFD2_20975 [Promethearchaeota archaeon]
MQTNYNMDIKKLDIDSHKICIWKDPLVCSNCYLNGKLHCHTQAKYSVYFAIGFLAALIPALIGIFFSGFQINILITIIVVWIIYSLFFFCGWESRILCSHCPYYANDNQKTLHCAINKGAYKISKFHPEPMKKSEKIQFIIGAGILIGYPIPFLIIGKQFLMLIFTLIGIGIWIIIIQIKVCPVCINFSCPLNRVSKDLVNEFLRLNPRIRDAWEKTGYKIE